MPRRRLRTAVAGVLATVLVTAVAACSGSSGSSGAGSKPTITIWNDALAVGSCGVPAADSFLTKAVNLFLKTNPGFNVKIAQVACDASPAFNTLLKSSEVAGTTPDIVQLYVGGQVIQNGKYLVPLNNYLPQSYISSLTGWKYVTDGYQSKPNGSIYAVPYGAGYWYFVYYNKSLFAKAGITNPQPATWADLIAIARKLKAKGITPFDIGEKEGYVGAWTQDALISALVGDAGVLKMFSGAQSLDSPALTQPYAAWHELFADGLTNSDAPSLTYSSGVADFASNVGLFPIPVLPGSQFPKSLSGGPNNAYSVFKTSKYVADDIKLIKFLTTLPVQELSVNELGQLPNNVSFAPSASFQAQQPLLTAQYKYIQVDHYALGEAFDNIMPGTIDSYWYQTNSAVFGGSLSPSSAAGSMQSQMKSYLATASSG